MFEKPRETNAAINGLPPQLTVARGGAAADAGARPQGPGLAHALHLLVTGTGNSELRQQVLLPPSHFDDLGLKDSLFASDWPLNPRNYTS